MIKKSLRFWVFLVSFCVLLTFVVVAIANLPVNAKAVAKPHMIKYAKEHMDRPDTFVLIEMVDLPHGRVRMKYRGRDKNSSRMFPVWETKTIRAKVDSRGNVSKIEMLNQK